MRVTYKKKGIKFHEVEPHNITVSASQETPKGQTFVKLSVLTEVQVASYLAPFPKPPPRRGHALRPV